MRLTQLVISLPLLLCAVQLSKPVSMANEAGMNAIDATKLLAKAQSIDTKCKILAADKAQELKDFVARAEISLAEKASVAVARSSISEGRAQGNAAACDATSSKLVVDVLAAAVGATSMLEELEPDTQTAETPKISVKPEPRKAEEQVALVAPKPVVAKAKPVANARPVQAPKPVVKAAKIDKPEKVKSRLGSYAVLAEKYYVARRCRNVSDVEMGRMYQAVLSNHKQALAANRALEVKAMLRAAEAKAQSRACG